MVKTREPRSFFKTTSQGCSRVEWTTEAKGTKEVADAAYAELKKPSPDFGKAAFGFLPSAAFSEAGTPDFTSRTDNELLGFRAFSEDQVMEVLEAAL